MKKDIFIFPYACNQRQGVLVQYKGGWGEVAPLPGFSRETLEDALEQLHSADKKQHGLYPSVSFGLESAQMPFTPCRAPVSALFMGSFDSIMEQAALREQQGFVSAKLKVGNLSFQDAERLIYLLKERFFLRIDVNRAWDTQTSLDFFSQFPRDAFDYVEEPFKNPHDLYKFTHPLAVDESFPDDLSLEDLENLTVLRALVYKPTLQGGLSLARPLADWARRRGIDFVLSSSFESDVGLAHIVSLACKLSTSPLPVGIGTYYHGCLRFLAKPLVFSKGECLVQGSAVGLSGLQ